MFDFYLIFFCPDARELRMLKDILESHWEMFLLIMLVFNIIMLGWFYFKSKPDKKAMLKFFLITGSIFLLGTIIGFLILYLDKDKLLQENQQWELRHTMSALFSSLFSCLEIYVIVLAIILFASILFPVKWQLKAMRRYPFKWIP